MDDDQLEARLQRAIEGQRLIEQTHDTPEAPHLRHRHQLIIEELALAVAGALPAGIDSQFAAVLWRGIAAAFLLGHQAGR